MKHRTYRNAAFAGLATLVMASTSCSPATPLSQQAASTRLPTNTTKSGPPVRPTAPQPSQSKPGTIWAWGYGNGTFGVEGGPNVGFPQRISSFRQAISVQSQSNITALYADGSVWQLGSTGSGLSGNPEDTVASTPVQVSGLPRMVQITPLAHQGLAADGTVWAWGEGSRGEFGDAIWAANRERYTPTAIKIPIPATIVQLENSAALANDGVVWLWGCERGIRLGGVVEGGIQGETCFKPTPLLDLPKMVAVSESSALSEDGHVYAWGRGDISSTAEPIAKFTNVTNIWSTPEASFFMTADKKLWAWGRGENGQLGDGKFIGTNDPVLVQGISNVTSIGWGGCGAIIASDANGDVWAWGGRGKSTSPCGEYGTGLETPPDSGIPVRIPSLKNVSSVGGTMAIVADAK